jgi:hypothetical protein
MKKLRTKLGNRLFDLARDTYKKNPFLGDKLFKLAALVSPNKKK